jgi:GxxExxY protein
LSFVKNFCEVSGGPVCSAVSMHRLYCKADKLSRDVIGAAIVRVEYKRLIFDEPLRFDILVDDCLLVELKATGVLHPVNKAQLFSYMKLLDIPIGLLINFHEPVLKNGIFRMILPGANLAEEKRRQRSDSLSQS